MQARSKLKPGQKGTIKLVEFYGSRLICVRYRYDEQSRKRLKTVELIVEESPWSPPSIKPDKLVGVRVEPNETELQRKVKLGGKWFPQHKVWHLRYDQAVALGLEARIEHRNVSSATDQVSSITDKHLIVDASSVPSNSCSVTTRRVSKLVNYVVMETRECR